MFLAGKGKGGGRVRAVLCASLCNCRHSLRADDDEGLVEAALDHLRRHHPAAPIGEERVRKIIFTRAYDIEYATMYAGSFGPHDEFGPEPY
jgi:predicted small metal-binding protein